MFKTKTTLILGAGASYSYGYPLGDELISRIMSECKSSKHGPQAKLYESLKFYDPISIDSFLMHYSHEAELIETAKHYISRILLAAPQEDLFLRGASLKSSGLGESHDYTNWYRFLWDAIVSQRTAEELADKNVNLNFDIITFNYDSSLEYFLARNIMSENSMFSHEQQAVFKSKMKERIHHVYGCLSDDYLSAGKYSEVGALHNHFFYKPDLDRRAKSFSANIRLINERQESEYDFIQNIISKSPQLIFLGFGFDDVNCGPKVLNLMSGLKARQASSESGYGVLPVVKYTNYGDSERINRKLQTYLYQQVDDNDLRYATRKIGSGVIKSTKKTYQAISEDFSLGSYL